MSPARVLVQPKDPYTQHGVGRNEFRVDFILLPTFTYLLGNPELVTPEVRYLCLSVITYFAVFIIIPN